MARELDEKDFAILRKLAPEYSGVLCPESGHEFHSILPPVSNHIAADEEDFAERVARLSDEDWGYLADQILAGREDLGCMPEEDIETILVRIQGAVSEEAAERVRRLYHLSGCGLL
ncbi:hypothetical protein [Methanoculleus horonobensis]|uniref:hypothetical protein n=1 Tax=Methanoculleus horonobensis TaxID=528314 RepID=UPI00082F3E94|nr:hypothetical protein [Methanoculleus horonobensis]MDD3070695.1 hypothetical protein [Methanoculleus horonobensis]MDD4252612.1 hypothetical protein [Methanoculleus horonobensis]